MTFRPRLIPLALLMFVAAAYADPIAPQTPIEPVTPPSLSTSTFEQLIAQLGHADFVRRDQASTELMLRDNIAEAQLAKAIAATESLEVRQRLIAVEMHHFFQHVKVEATVITPDGADDDGALGVSFSSALIDGDQQTMVVRAHQHLMLDHPAMLVSRVYPGFPAFAYLQPGDMIYAVDGKFFSDDLNHEEFQDRIRNYKAGERVTMDVIRGGRAIRLHVQLGRRSRLEEVSKLLGGTSDPALYVPWRLHLRQLLQGANEPAPITFVPVSDPAQASPAPAARADHEPSQ